MANPCKDEREDRERNIFAKGRNDHLVICSLRTQCGSLQRTQMERLLSSPIAYQQEGITSHSSHNGSEQTETTYGGGHWGSGLPHLSSN